MDKNLLREIEKQLGYNEFPPIVLSPSDQKDIDEKGDVFRAFYEETLWARFHEAEEEEM